MKVLAIESSCDDTSIAVLDGRHIELHHTYTQITQHAPFAGVVPELAARAHLSQLRFLLDQAALDFSKIDGIAATAGPGLMGGLLVGLLTAKTLACALGKPFLAINHLEGHILTPRLSHDFKYPYLALLSSGGHGQFVAVYGLGEYKILGKTLDDAAGEAFDKIAKMLDLGFPGGPAVERMARAGDPKRFELPLPLVGRSGCDLSFSGLKTAVRMHIQSLLTITEQDKADLCASAQFAIVECLMRRTQNALDLCGLKRFSVVGGVAANQTLRSSLEILCQKRDLEFVAPPLNLCTDNAAMIAWAANERFEQGLTSQLDYPASPRWSLEDLSIPDDSLPKSFLPSDA